MNKKFDLTIIISGYLIISVISIVVFNLEFGLIKVPEQVIRLTFWLVFSYFLYQEKQWARWTFVVMSLLAGVAGLLGILIALIQKGDKIIFAIILLSLMSLFYLASGVYLGFIRKWKK